MATTEQEKQEAASKLADLEDDLKSAKDDLSSLKQQGMSRRDGSAAQDRRFEDALETRKDRVKNYQDAVNRQKELIENL